MAKGVRFKTEKMPYEVKPSHTNCEKNSQFTKEFWCNTHNRHCNEDGCDPKLGGIMIPCCVVEITDIATVEKALDGNVTEA